MNMLNTDSLIKSLADTLVGLKSGRVNVTKARAIAALASSISEASKVQIEYAKATNRRPLVAMLECGVRPKSVSA